MREENDDCCTFIGGLLICDRDSALGKKFQSYLNVIEYHPHNEEEQITNVVSFVGSLFDPKFKGAKEEKARQSAAAFKYFFEYIIFILNNTFNCPTCGKPMVLSRVAGRPKEWVCDRDIMHHYESVLIH